MDGQQQSIMSVHYHLEIQHPLLLKGWVSLIEPRLIPFLSIPLSFEAALKELLMILLFVSEISALPVNRLPQFYPLDLALIYHQGHRRGHHPMRLQLIVVRLLKDHHNRPHDGMRR